MTLLFFYLGLALGVSFLCSLCEAVLLTLTVSDAEIMTKAGKRVGPTLRKMKDSIDRPLAAILTLNTVSHTVGAAGVGAQAIIVFGEASIGLVSGVLTLLILVTSEIIPKTIGANFARPLATPTTWVIRAMIWTTYPLVILLNFISKLLPGRSPHGMLAREQIEVMAEIGRTGGGLDPAESQIITNMLRLRELRVADVLTPRKVLHTLSRGTTVREAYDKHRPLRFTRIPVTGEGIDDILGFVLRQDLYRAILEGTPDKPVEELVRPMRAVPENASLLAVMQQFGSHGQHCFLVVDEYGGTAGVVSLEDVIESILGSEIVDETDPVADMRALATRRAGRRKKQAPGG